MAKMNYQVDLTPDGQSAVLDMQQDGKPETAQHLILDASGLEGLIRQLSKIRSTLPETVTPTLDPGSRLDAEINPAWVVQHNSHSGSPGAVLAVRHAGLGWLGFHFPKDGAMALRDALASAVEPPRP